MRKKILITSIGSLVGQNILKVLNKRRENLFIVGTNSISEAPIYDCDKVYLTPRSVLPPSNFSKSISKIIIDESPDLILPGRDIDVVILSIIKSKFPEIANRFLLGESNLAYMMEDKWRGYQFAKKEGLPFADTIICDLKNNKNEIDLLVQNHGFPLIVKPRKGFASKGVSIVLNYDQMYNISSDSEMIIQEYLGKANHVKEFQNLIKNEGFPLFYSFEEEKYSLQFFIDRSGLIKGNFATINKMKGGVSESITIAKKHELGDTMNKYSKVFSKNGWYGPVNIQMKKSYKTGDLKAYEFNGRFTGATAARYFLGYDEVGLALDEMSLTGIGKDNRFGSQKTVRKQPVVSVIPDKLMFSLEKTINGNGYLTK